MTTQEDIAGMTSAELAAFANKAPEGFTPVFCADGTFMFIANWLLEELPPSQREAITVVQRSH